MCCKKTLMNSFLQTLFYGKIKKPIRHYVLGKVNAVVKTSDFERTC